MFSISDLRRRSSLSFANSKLARMQNRLLPSTSEQADQVRGRPESVAVFPVSSGTKRAMSASVIERPRSVNVLGALPELSFDDFSFDPQSVSQPANPQARTALDFAWGEDMLAARPALTSKSTTHIATQLNTENLLDDSRPALRSRFVPTTSMTAAQADKAPSTVTNGEPDESPTSTASSNFEQLVRDTENAFDAVNSALVEMRAIRASHASSPSLPPTPPPKDPARSVPPKSAARTARQPSLPPRRKSTKSVKSQKSQKSLKSRTSPPRRKATTASRASSKKAGRRWGIPGNMSDLFSMRMFQKIEADEVVTPIQIEAFKIRKMSLALAEQEVQEREKAAGSRSSLESMLPDQSESSNGSSTGPRTPPLVDSPSSIYSSDEPTRTALSLATVNSTAKDLDGRLSDDEPGFTFLDDSTPSECGSPVFTSQEELPSLPSPPPPLPPAKNPLRSALARKKLSPLLPSLPEDSEASAMISEPPSSSSSRGSGDFVYLPSTPCTLTAPRFRHGHIRVSRPPMPQDGIMGFDDGLDWTAFQMAIQGGAGDWYSENEETTRRREADEAKDVVAWWTTWNFESAGALVSADQKNPDATVQPSDGSGSGSGRSSMDSSENADSFTCLSDGSDEHDEDEDDDEEDVDELSDDLAAYSLSPSNPYNAHRKWRNADDTDDSASATRRLEIDTSKQVLMLDATAAAEGLQVVHNSSSDNVDFVPMGCNLTSDLGDFLRWEAEYAFAGNFYSGPTR